MTNEEVQIERIEVVKRLDNVWVHFHLLAPLPEHAGTTITVEAASHDAATQLIGVNLNHPDPSELFVGDGSVDPEVVGVTAGQLSNSVLTVAFPAEAFEGLGDDPVFSVQVERGGDGRELDAPVTFTEPPPVG